MTILKGNNDLNLNLIEREFTIKELYNSDEVFITSSGSLITPIVQVDKFKINNVLRVTGDNPLTDYLLIDEMINYFLKNTKYDFITNNYFANKKKRRLAYGLDLSLFSINSLKKVKKFAGKNKVFQEYPTLYYHTKGKSKFKIKFQNLKNKFKMQVMTHL